MQLPFLLLVLEAVFFSCSAYDNFQGLGKLPEKPCFPHFIHSECNSTLVDSYTPPAPTASSNDPTTRFFLFTPTNQDKAEQLFDCGGGLPPNSSFDPNSPTEVFVHGHSDGVCRTAWMREVKEQLYQKSKFFNVILVDWTWGNFPDPLSAVINAKVAGYHVARVLENIANQTGYDCSKYHVIGQSYGVVVVSQAGKAMQDKSCRIGRITALDNALPGFKYATEEERLNPTDADFVDAVYTNAGDCFPFNYGDARPMAHVNFYINDGTHQYSCYPYAFISLLKLDIFYGIATLAYPALCYHAQSIQYYKASILAEEDNTQMIGVQCDSYDSWMDGSCKRNCEKEGNCLPVGMDLPKYIDTSKVDNREKKIFYVPEALLCPYADHSGFTGLPLKQITPTSSQR